MDRLANRKVKSSPDKHKLNSTSLVWLSGAEACAMTISHELALRVHERKALRLIDEFLQISNGDIDLVKRNEDRSVILCGWTKIHKL